MFFYLSPSCSGRCPRDGRFFLILLLFRLFFCRFSLLSFLFFVFCFFSDFFLRFAQKNQNFSLGFLSRFTERKKQKKTFFLFDFHLFCFDLFSFWNNFETKWWFLLLFFFFFNVVFVLLKTEEIYVIMCFVRVSGRIEDNNSVWKRREKEDGGIIKTFKRSFLRQ